MFVYILKLENDNYYVGKTKHIEKRLLRHLSSEGSEWTKKHKPVDIIFVKNIKEGGVSDYFEDILTLETMGCFGINKVRGGSFSKLYLNRTEQHIINKMMASARDLCFKCGVPNHYAKECTNF